MKRYATYLQWIDQQQELAVDLLRRWAEINTGSTHRGGLRAFATHLATGADGLLRGDGERGEVRMLELPRQEIVTDAGEIESRELGCALSIRSGGEFAKKAETPRVLLAIHYDTVFAEDDQFQKVSRGPENNIMVGPGVCDAKGGLMVMLLAVRALARSPFAEGIRWEMLLNPDEEIGSPGSGHLFTEAAARNDLALLFEPALPDGALVSSRKGSGNYALVVRGRAAHAGRDAHAGRNAIHALAAAITRLAALPRDLPDVTVNTGFIHGGGPVNIVPDRAMARINFRVATADQQQAVQQMVRETTAEIARAHDVAIDVHGGFHCPPKPLTPAVERLLGHLANCGRELGVPLQWRATGGACDGNRLAAAGLPTVDSLGVRGGNIHTDREFVYLDSIAERARITALFLMRLANGEIAFDRRQDFAPSQMAGGVS